MKVGRPAVETGKKALHMQVPSEAIAVAMVVILTGGCLSPATIRTVAIHNSQNVSNYNANVAALAHAITREVDLHCSLEIEIARTQFAGEFVRLWENGLLSQDADDQKLADPQNPMCKYLNAQIAEARQWTGSDNDQAMKTAVVEKYPLVADIVYETPGFSPLRVMMDARRLVQMNREINKAPGSDLTRALMDKRARLLDQYLWVRQRSELMQTYQQELAEFVTVVLEQGQVAAGHANCVLAYANSEPQVSTLASALRDEQLQQRVLTLVEKKQGAPCAARLQEYLGKANDALRIIDGLSKNPG